MSNLFPGTAGCDSRQAQERDLAGNHIDFQYGAALFALVLIAVRQYLPASRQPDMSNLTGEHTKKFNELPATSASQPPSRGAAAVFAWRKMPLAGTRRIPSSANTGNAVSRISSVAG